MLGKLKDINLNLDGTQNIIITVQSDFREAYEELKEFEVDVEIKKPLKPNKIIAT